MRLLLGYVHERTAIAPSDLDISVLDAELIGDFLTMLEERRGNGAWPLFIPCTATPPCATPSTSS